MGCRDAFRVRSCRGPRTAVAVRLWLSSNGVAAHVPDRSAPSLLGGCRSVRARRLHGAGGLRPGPLSDRDCRGGRLQHSFRYVPARRRLVCVARLPEHQRRQHDAYRIRRRHAVKLRTHQARERDGRRNRDRHTDHGQHHDFAHHQAAAAGPARIVGGSHQRRGVLRWPNDLDLRSRRVVDP